MQPRRRPHHGNLPPAWPRRTRCATPGLPADYPHDISYRTTFTGQELTRIQIPCRRDRFTSDGWARIATGRRRSRRTASTRSFSSRSCSSTPRRSRASASSTGRRSKTWWCRIRPRDVTLRDLDTGAVRRSSCRYLIGCDGARSDRPQGDRRRVDRRRRSIQRVQSTFIRAPRPDRPSAAAIAPGAPAPSIRGARAWCMRSTAASAGWCTIT